MSYISTFTVGSTHAVRDGLLTIKHYKSSQEVHVVFQETGYETVARAQHILVGSVKDRMKKSKRERIREGKALVREDFKYEVVDRKGKVHLFDSIAKLAEHFCITPTSVYSHMRGETVSRAFATLTKIKSH